MKHTKKTWIIQCYLTCLSMLLFVLVSCNSVDEYSDDHPTGNLDVTAPESSSIKINEDDPITYSRFVTITLRATDNVGVTAYVLSEDSEFIFSNETIPWTDANNEKDISVDVSFELSIDEGTKNIYAWFKDAENNVSARSTDSIELIALIDDFDMPANPSIVINSGNPQTASIYVNVDLSADDNKGVTAYYLSEESSEPEVNAAGWVSVGSSGAYSGTGNFILSDTEEIKTIYAWFKDAAGNISESSSDTIEYTTVSSDVTAPFNVALLINNDDLETTSLTLTIDLSADDDEGVTAFYLSENVTPPDAVSPGWTSVSSTASYSGSLYFVLNNGTGEKTVYGWFKDAAGNVSDTTFDTITYSIYDTEPPDNTDIIINNGDISTDTLNVSISLAATDNYGVIGYCLSEDGTTPDPGNPAWVTVDSSTDFSGMDSFTFSNGYGDKTVYIFFKDDAGNVSLTSSDTILFKVEPYIFAGGYHSCAVTNDGTEYCWGSNNWGQLADVDLNNHLNPIPVGDIDDTVQFAGSATHTCALIKGGTIKCWGDNRYGQLGLERIDSVDPQITPEQISTNHIDSAVQIYAGNYHGCALLANSSIKCWGLNNYGQLGYGSLGGSLPVPIQVSGITNAVQIAQGQGMANHACVTLDDGKVNCWGRGNARQLGINETTNKSEPVEVTGITTAVQVDVGYLHSCAVLINGAVKCWGLNNYGQLGYGDNSVHTEPVVDVVDIDGSTDVAVQVALGYYHSCAILDTGAVKCWGYGGYGQLGTGNNGTSYIPVDVVDITNAVQLSLGVYHSCALLDDGDMQCWGYGVYGQTGFGAPVNVNRPVSVDF